MQTIPRIINYSIISYSLIVIEVDRATISHSFIVLSYDTEVTLWLSGSKQHLVIVLLWWPMENTPRGTIAKLLPSFESLALHLSAQVWKAELPTAAVCQSICKTDIYEGRASELSSLLLLRNTRNQELNKQNLKVINLTILPWTHTTSVALTASKTDMALPLSEPDTTYLPSWEILHEVTMPSCSIVH